MDNLYHVSLGSFEEHDPTPFLHFRNYLLFEEDLVLNLNTLECLEKIFKLPHPISAFS